jgi:hypothetical protein
VSQSDQRLPAELPLRQLEIATALRSGAEGLNQRAAGILATLFGYAEKADHPHHEWALRLLAERILPRKLYEDLGGQAAGIKTGQGTIRPAVNIIIQPAAGPGQAGQSFTIENGMAYEGRPREIADAAVVEVVDSKDVQGATAVVAGAVVHGEGGGASVDRVQAAAPDRVLGADPGGGARNVGQVREDGLVEDIAPADIDALVS